MNKKAQMSSPLSYIFALVVGAVVFVFLIGFAYQFIGFSGSLSAAETVGALDDEFYAFSVSESAEKVIDYGKDFDFMVYLGSVSTNGFDQSFDHIMFSPLEIQGEFLYVATKALEIPYKVTNLFYLSDGNTIYILVYDSNSEEVVEDLQSSYSSIPQNFASEAFSITQVSANIQELYELTAQYSHVRFIFFTSYESVLDDIQSTFPNYDILSVSSTYDDYSFGEVEFSDGTEVIYLDYPLLIGAMISSNAASYEYNLEKVFEKADVVTKVYYDKAKFLSSRASGCEYGAIKTSLGSYRSSFEEIATYTSYSSKIESLEDLNKDFGGDCPEVF